MSAGDVQAAIDLLNQDFRAIGQGLGGIDTRVEFELAHFAQYDNSCWSKDYHSTDNPDVTGCASASDYYTNSWDVDRYANIYVPAAVRSDALGYVSGFPADSCVIVRPMPKVVDVIGHAVPASGPYCPAPMTTRSYALQPSSPPASSSSQLSCGKPAT